MPSFGCLCVLRSLLSSPVFSIVLAIMLTLASRLSSHASIDPMSLHTTFILAGQMCFRYCYGV